MTIVYELRKQGHGDPLSTVMRTEPSESDDQWPVAQQSAEELSGSWDVFRVAGGLETYVVSSGPYWRSPIDGCSHQIGSMGRCWDCWSAGLGWIRHPVTPSEALGEPEPPRCRATAIFWPGTNDAEEGECHLPAGHDPANRHRSQRTGIWEEASTPGLHWDGDDFDRRPSRERMIYELPTTHAA
jgi:hypothetical protein